MRVLVLSDSHSGLSFMRKAIAAVKPKVVVHLGDYYSDGESMAEENPHTVFHLLGGNCDRYRSYELHPERICCTVDQVRFFMVHGHGHNVKQGLYRLLADARENAAQAVLYGHTHIPDCHREEDGLWVVNPGSCSSMGGSAAVITIENSEITHCRIVRQEELENIL